MHISLAAQPDPPLAVLSALSPNSALCRQQMLSFPSSPHHVGGSAASRLSGCFHELSLLSSFSVVHLLPLFSSAVADDCAARLGWETPLTTKPCVRGLPVCSLQTNAEPACSLLGLLLFKGFVFISCPVLVIKTHIFPYSCQGLGGLALCLRANCSVYICGGWMRSALCHQEEEEEEEDARVPRTRACTVLGLCCFLLSSF